MPRPTRQPEPAWFGSARRRGQPLRPDDEVPGLDARDREPVRVRPGVVGEALANLRLGVRLNDQQGAQACGLGSGERPREEDQAFIGEGVHESGVVSRVWLGGDPAVAPARARFADDGVVAHRAWAIREWKVFWSR